MLHLVFELSTDNAVLARLGEGDAVIFLENAVLRLLRAGNLNHTLSKLLAQHRLFVLTDELAVRGIQVDDLVQGIQAIDYAAFVALSVKHSVNHSWT